MANVNMYLQPDERYQFDLFCAHFLCHPGKCFTYIVSKYVGYEIKNPVFNPKSPEEVDKLYKLSPPNRLLKKAHEILCEGGAPFKYPTGMKTSIHLAEFMEPRFSEVAADSTRGKVGVKAIRSYFGSKLDPQLEELFNQLLEYGFDDGIPDLDTLKKTGLDQIACVLLDSEAIRKLYAGWLK